MIFPLDFQIGQPLRDVLLGNCWHSMKPVTECSTAGFRARNQGCGLPSGQPHLLDAFSNDGWCLDTRIPALHLQCPYESSVCDSVRHGEPPLCARPSTRPFNTPCLILTRTVCKGHYLHLPVEETEAHRKKMSSLSSHCNSRDSDLILLASDPLSSLDASFLWVSEIAWSHSKEAKFICFCPLGRLIFFLIH